MIGSPDLLAFTGTEGFGEGDEDQEGQSLPEELSVPLCPPDNPWSSTAQFLRDFILVAEFSEQVGPKPVLTIPEDPRAIGTFDLNHFSVRLMSVDYQASGPVHTAHATPGPRLNFSEDSKVILGDSAQDAFAYVHHMTLYDLEARGMVRPFCVAYVCSDQAKLMENFSELSTCFTQASDSLKTGNRQAFSMELQRKLQELEYRRVTLLETDRVAPVNGFTVGEKDGDLEAVERSISTHRDLLRQVTSYPNRKLKQPDFLPYDPADSLPDLAALPPPEPSPPASGSYRSEHRLKQLHELCNSYFLSLMKEQLADTERRLRGDRSALRTARVSRWLSRRLTLTNFLFELWSPEDEEEEEEEEEEERRRRSAGSELQRTSKSNGEVPRSEPMSLESFCSCVEELPIKLEAGEARMAAATPDLDVAMEMTGSVSSNDSIEVLGTEKSYRTQHVVTGSDGAESTVLLMDSSARRAAAADAGVRRMRAYAKRANSEDSIEVLSTTESIFPDDLTAITEEDAEQQQQQQPLSNGFDNEDESVTERRSEEKILNAAPREDETEIELSDLKDDNGVDKEKPFKQITKEPVTESLKKNQDTSPVKTPKLQREALKLLPKLSEVCQTVQSVPDIHVNFAPPVALAELDHWSPPCAPLRLLSIDEASDCTSFTGSSDPPSPTQNIHSSSSSARSHQRRRRRRKAGLRALRFLKQNSFSQHAVFCLLSGRPLVVVGGDETLVRKLVDALSLFLPAPGPDGNAVMLCLTTPLQLTDLLTWRLIGIHRSSSSSSSTIIHSLTRYSRYLALLDLDQRTLRCPSYCGSLVGRLANPHSSFSRGITYLLHLESGLTALANQALLHTFGHREQRPPSATDGEEEQPPPPPPPPPPPGCSSRENDLRVMSFLSDLIKQRHAGRGPPALRFVYSSVQLHKNTIVT